MGHANMGEGSKDQEEASFAAGSGRQKTRGERDTALLLAPREGTC